MLALEWEFGTSRSKLLYIDIQDENTKSYYTVLGDIFNIV